MVVVDDAEVVFVVVLEVVVVVVVLVVVLVTVNVFVLSSVSAVSLSLSNLGTGICNYRPATWDFREKLWDHLQSQATSHRYRNDHDDHTDMCH